MHMASAFCDRKNKLFIKGKCFNDCEAKLIVGEEETELYVCMEQLAHLSEYFRAMFFGDFQEKYRKEFQINDETTDDMVCFLNAIDPDPRIQNISDESIELLMRMADKYQCDILKEKLYVHIKSHRNQQSSSTTLNWLIWSLQYHMSDEMVKICLPSVACLPLSTLVANQAKIGLDLFNKLIDTKVKLLLNTCKSCIDQASEICAFHKKSKRWCECRRQCDYCHDHPTIDANEQQCFCARKKYVKLFNN